MSIKGCLFDFDGTLFFNSELHKVSISRIFVKYYNAPAPDYPTMTNQFFGRPNADVFRSYVDPNATDEEVKYFDALKEQDFRNLCLERKDDLHLVEGATELLDYLKDEMQQMGLEIPISREDEARMLKQWKKKTEG